MGLTDIYQDLLKCNRCGLCQGACPIYKATGLETSVARGHHAVLREIIEGKLPFLKEAREPLYDCLLCRGCLPPCMPAVPTDSIVINARQAYLKKFGLPLGRRLIFRGLLPNRRLLGLAVGFMALGQAAGAARIARAMSSALTFGHELVPQLPFPSLRSRWLRHPLPQVPGAKKRLAYFLGCGFNYILQRVGEATVAVLAQAGYQVVVPEHECCALPIYAYGDLEGARALARRNIEMLEKVEADAIVTDCASCSSFLKEYRGLLAEDEEFSSRASALATKVMDINQLLAPEVSRLKVETEYNELTVTFHDPCHLTRYQGIKEEPRALLKAIPGINFTEMAEADWCCGSAGTYNLEHYPESMAVLKRKMDNIKATTAQVVATSCPACMLQLSLGARRQREGIKVVHVTELLAGKFHL